MVAKKWTEPIIDLFVGYTNHTSRRRRSFIESHTVRLQMIADLYSHLRQPHTLLEDINNDDDDVVRIGDTRPSSFDDHQLLNTVCAIVSFTQTASLRGSRVLFRLLPLPTPIE